MKKFSALLIAIVLYTFCPAQKAVLRLNLEKDKVYGQEMSSVISIDQQIAGQPFHMNMKVDAVMTYKVTQIAGDVYDMEVCYRKMMMDMTSPAGKVQYSSVKSDADDILSSVMGSMINRPFLVKMTKTGRVTEVKNIEEVFEHMFDSFPDLDEAQKQKIKDQLMKSYGEKAFIGNLEMCSAIFPDSAVAQGDKWDISVNLESGMNVNVNTSYELKAIRKSGYTISGISSMKSIDPESYSELNGMMLRYDLTGIMMTEIIIDKQSGWVISSKTNQGLKGMAYIKDNPQIPGGMKIPITINNNMTISGN